MKDNLEIVLKLFAIIGSLYGAYLVIKNKWRNYVNKRNYFYGGNWNNQGQIKNVPSHYVDIDARASTNKFNGNFNVRKGNDENTWEMFKVSGKRYLGKLKCIILKVINGEEKVVATGVLTKKGAILKWTLIKSDSDQFPKETLLRKGLPKIT